MKYSIVRNGDAILDTPPFGKGGLLYGLKIDMIKAIRAITLLGLKEAKELVEEITVNNTTITITAMAPKEVVEKNLQILRRMPLTVIRHSTSRDMIKDVIVAAVNENDFEVAAALIDVAIRFYHE